jgi:hypothetical protein
MKWRYSVWLKPSKVPLWVACAHFLMEWVDYKIVSPVRSWLLWTRLGLIDKYCDCEECQKRRGETT